MEEGGEYHLLQDEKTQSLAAVLAFWRPWDRNRNQNPQIVDRIIISTHLPEKTGNGGGEWWWWWWWWVKKIMMATATRLLGSVILVNGNSRCMEMWS